MFIPSLLVFLGLIWTSHGLDNGVGLTPPMGWLSWLRYECNTDCDTDPYNCLNDQLIKTTADMMASEGYLDAGYQYVIIDDCWPEMSRGSDGRLVADKKRFPNGILGLSRYVHYKGLNFGIYEDYGNFTCQNYPGVLGHEATDVATFLDWEVDYVKLDGCNNDVSSFDTGYPMFGKLLNETGRQMVYSCSWPAYQENPNYSAIAKACNIWRNHGDIENSWESVVKIMNWFGDNQDQFAHLAGPGSFNDPDMLVIGNSGLTVDQARVQMAVWSVLAAPLLMSVDLAFIEKKFSEILLNKDVIAVDQDPLGKQGLRVFTGADNDVIWHREISDGARALAFVNLQDLAVGKTYTHEQMKLPSQDYVVQDLFNEDKERTLGGGEDLEVKINPTGVKFYKFVPKKESEEEPVCENEIKSTLLHANKITII